MTTKMYHHNEVLSEIGAERVRQVREKGCLPERDDRYGRGELAFAAATYAVLSAERVGADIGREREGPSGWLHIPRLLWPWPFHMFKLKNRRRDLIKAAALLVAEIERLDRLEARPKGAPDGCDETPSAKIRGEDGALRRAPV